MKELELKIKPRGPEGSQVEPGRNGRETGVEKKQRDPRQCLKKTKMPAAYGYGPHHMVCGWTSLEGEPDVWMDARHPGAPAG